MQRKFHPEERSSREYDFVLNRCLPLRTQPRSSETSDRSAAISVIFPLREPSGIRSRSSLHQSRPAFAFEEVDLRKAPTHYLDLFITFTINNLAGYYFADEKIAAVDLDLTGGQIVAQTSDFSRRSYWCSRLRQCVYTVRSQRGRNVRRHERGHRK